MGCRSLCLTRCCVRGSFSLRTVGAATSMQPAPLPERCLLCTSVVSKTLEEALADMQEAKAKGADVVELRLDCLTPAAGVAELSALLEKAQLPVIVTARASFEGGHFVGTEESRLQVLWQAVLLGAAFVDVELLAAERFFAAAPEGWRRENCRTRFILSTHDFLGTPSLAGLRATHAKAVSSGADIVKIATTAGGIMDVEPLVHLLRESGTVPTIALSMGEAGLVRQTSAIFLIFTQRTQISRLLAPKWGSFLTFGALAVGKESAPGQPTLENMLSVFRLHTQVR